MRKFILKTFEFLSFACLFYVVFIMIYGLVMPGRVSKNLRNFPINGFTHKMLSEVEKFEKADILVLGSSHANRGYDPRIFKEKKGLSLINLGTNAQTPLQTNYMFKTYGERLKPKFVILDAYHTLFASDGVESSLDIISNGKINGHLIRMTSKVNDIRAYNILIFNSLSKILRIQKQTEGKNPGDTYIPGGFIQTFGVNKTLKKHKTTKLQFSQKQFKAFEELVNSLKKNKIKYVIVQAPVKKAYYESFDNMEELDNWLSKLGPHYNFNKIIEAPDEMYIDDNHLNQTGVVYFNATLLDTLEKDHHLDLFSE